MQKYIVVFFSAMLFLSACTGNGSKNGIIKHDQMISLLVDVHIVDGSMYSAVAQNPDSLYKYGTARYLVLFKKYHVDSAAFRKSIRYYSNKPAEFEAMYQAVLDRLKQKTDSLNNTLLKKNNAPRQL